MGSVHHLGKFIPNLSQLCFPLRPLLKKTTKFFWTDEHEKQFKLIKEKIAETTENKHFCPDLETRIKCDSSRKGLGCALEQRTPNGWHTVAFASRFLNSVEDRYSLNELELLGVVWSIGHFKCYLYGKLFTVITDHRALLSIMRENRANKSYNSRLTLWVDRLLPFDFTIDHLPGSKMGLVDYISRNPQQIAVNISAYDEQFIVAILDVIKRSAKRFLVNAANYVDFAARNGLIKPVSNTPISNRNLCGGFAQRNPEYSAIMENDNSISKSEPNNSNSNLQIETVNIPHSLFALKHSTDKLPIKLNNFQRIANRFNSVLMMSNSNEETLMQVKQSTPSKVTFADEARPSVTFHRRSVYRCLQFCTIQNFLQYTDAQPNHQGRDPQRNKRLNPDGKRGSMQTDFTLYPFFLEAFARQQWKRVHRWKNRHPELDQGCVRGSHSCNPLRKLGDDRYGDTCMVALHASGHSYKDGKVQSLC